MSELSRYCSNCGAEGENVEIEDTASPQAKRRRCRKCGFKQVWDLKRLTVVADNRRQLQRKGHEVAI